MSGACYENGLLGKPAGEPGLAEYFSDVDGACVKDSSYVPCPDFTCCDIDALACFSSRATRERPLPAAAEASNCAILGNRHRLCGTSSPSSPDRPLTNPFLRAQLLRRCADPPRVRRLRYRARLRHLLLHLHHHPGTSTLSEVNRQTSGFPKQRFGVSKTHFSTFPENPSLKVFGVRNRFVMSTRQRVERKLYLYFVRATIFFVLWRRSSDGKKRSPTDEPSLPLTPKQITQTPYTTTGVHGPALRRHEHLL